MGHKRDRQTNVLISKSGKQLGALSTMEHAGLSGLERVWVESTAMPPCSSQEQEQQHEAALAEMTRVERVGKYGEYCEYGKRPCQRMPMQIGSSERGGKRLGGRVPVRAGHLG